MRRFSKVLKSRAGLILGGAFTSMLVLPGTALAGGFSGPRGGVQHPTAGGGGSTELVIFIGIIAAAVVSVLIISRIDTISAGRRRTANSIQRKPAGAGS
jgi:hypothetical protein